jgi:hypothetical protein
MPKRQPLPLNRFVTNRKVTREECHWLDADVDAGTVVTRFDGCTYGCVSPGGVAVTFVDGGPFCELPADALVMA